MSTFHLLLYYGRMSAHEARQEEMSLRGGLAEIYRHVSPARRRQFYFVVVLLLAGAIAELATIGAVIPFLALLAGAGTPGHHSHRFFVDALLTRQDALLIATGAFIAFAIVAGVVRLQLAWSSRNLVLQIGHDLAVEIQTRVMFQPYSFHTDRNSSTLASALAKVEMLVHEVLLPLMHAVSSAVIALFVIAILLFVDPLTTLCAAAAFAAIYTAVWAFTRDRLRVHSEAMETAYDQRLQTVQESLGGIREVIIDGSQAMYIRVFAAIDRKLAYARAAYQFMSAAPRLLIETIGMVVIAMAALLLSRQRGGIAVALPTLGAVVLGAQRLLPLVQQMYAGWSSARAQQSLFGHVLDLLRLPADEDRDTPVSPMQLERHIRLDDVSFTYPGRVRTTLEHVNLTIAKGSMVAVVGRTGSGKSTLLDLLMGLLQPDDGRVLLDDVLLTPKSQRQWHRSIAHVPQSIFLTDSTIARNIALSLPDKDPDPERIVASAKKAQLHDFVVSLPAGYETEVGERGVRLSGGQRQRLGIARAIYKDAPILVLDEATSALDELTEMEVIASLEELRREGRTIVIVAHRLSTIRHCDVVARLQHGHLVECGSLAEVLGAQASAAS